MADNDVRASPYTRVHRHRYWNAIIPGNRPGNVGLVAFYGKSVSAASAADTRSCTSPLNTDTNACNFSS
jgi:hypothetical protein